MVTHIKKCPECESENISINKERGEVTCRDCGLVIEERMIDFGQEWREFDDDQEKRRRTGAPLSYSVDAEEPLIIRRGGEIAIVKIGEFVDTYLKRSPLKIQREGEVEYTTLDDTVEAVAFDNNYKIAFHPIKEVLRHPAETVYEITLDTGKKVKVTDSHSVFTIQDNKVTPIKVSNLKVGTFIVAPKYLPLIESEDMTMNSQAPHAQAIVTNQETAQQLLFAEKKHSITLAQSHFKFLRVRSIAPCKSSNGYAYDISVPNCENFVGGRGAIFLHNTRYDRGLGTDIGQKGDIFQLKGKGMNKFFRLRKWQYRISTAIERNLKLALAELKRVASYLKLTKSVEEEAARIYTMAVQRGLVRGRSMESVVAGALYAACRRHEVPRTLDELSEASGIDKKEVGRTYRFITRELGIRILPSNPVDYIPRFTSALKLSPETQSKAVEILELAEKSELTSGRGPTGIAAASLYVAALINNEKRTQREVADIAGVTEVTIRNRYKELFKKLKLKEGTATKQTKPKKSKK